MIQFEQLTMKSNEIILQHGNLTIGTLYVDMYCKIVIPQGSVLFVDQITVNPRHFEHLCIMKPLNYERHFSIEKKCYSLFRGLGFFFKIEHSTRLSNIPYFCRIKKNVLQLSVVFKLCYSSHLFSNDIF